MPRKIVPRMHTRIPTRMRALLIRPEKTEKAIIHELSAGGCLLECTTVLAKGDELTVASTFETTNEKMYRGRVLYALKNDPRIEREDTTAGLLGVYFEGLGADDKTFLERVVKENRFKMFRRAPMKNLRPR